LGSWDRSFLLYSYTQFIISRIIVIVISLVPPSSLLHSYVFLRTWDWGSITNSIDENPLEKPADFEVFCKFSEYFAIWIFIKIYFNNILSLSLVLLIGPFFHVFPPKPWNGTVIIKLAILLRTSKLILIPRYRKFLIIIQHFNNQLTHTTLTHCGPVTQICVFALQLCKTDEANLRF